MVSAVHRDISFTIGALLGVGMMFLALTSITAACISGSPFGSPFSDVMRFILE